MQELQKPKHGYRIVQDFFKRKFEIPENWEYLKFSNVVSVNPRTKVNSTAALYVPMEAVNTQNGSVDFFEERNLDENFSLPKFQENDILFARITPCTENGKVCIIEKFLGQGIASSELTVLRPSNRVLPHYLFYFVQTYRVRQFAISQMMGTTGRQRVPDSVFKKDLNFQLPALDEQSRIVKILSNIHLLIQKTDQVIEQTQRLKKGLMQKLLTKGIGYTKLKNIKIFGEEIKVPEEWYIVSLDDVCNNITDGKHGDCQNERASGYYFISAKDILDGEIHYENARQITKQDFLDANKRTKLEPGDILLTNSGTIGKLAIVKNCPRTAKTTFQKSVAIIKPITDKVTVEYLYYYLLQNQKRLENISAGSSQRNLLLITLKSFDIVIPNNLDEQKKIGKILLFVDRQVQSEKTCKSDLAQLKKGLMQKLLTGKIRVKV